MSSRASISGGFQDAPWSFNPWMSSAPQDVRHEQRSDQHHADSELFEEREYELKRKCMMLLCSQDRCDRGPICFGIHRVSPYRQRQYPSSLVLNMRYVQDIYYAYATNDPKIFNPKGQEELESIFDNEGWVLPLREGTRRETGTRVRVILTTNPTPMSQTDHVSLVLLEGDMSGSDRGEIPPDTDLGLLNHWHCVRHDNKSGGEHRADERLNSYLKVGPYPLYGALCAAGCVNICLDELWDDIFPMLKFVFQMWESECPLKSAVEEYSRYLNEKREREASLRTVKPWWRR
jgi:hypothetical protein